MNVADDDIGRKELGTATADAHAGNSTVRLFNTANLRSGKHFPAQGTDLLSKTFRNLLPAAFEAPGTADEGVVDLCKGVKRSGFVHRAAHESALQHTAQCGIRYRFLNESLCAASEKRIGATLQRFCVIQLSVFKKMWPEGPEDIVSYIFEKGDIFAKSIPFLREVLRQAFHEIIIAGCKGVTVPVDDDFVHAVRVHPLPGKVQQAEISENAMKALAFVQGADIMETGIEGQVLRAGLCLSVGRLRLSNPSAKTLKASADAHGVLFQHRDVIPGTGEDQATFQPAQPAADYYRSLGHPCVTSFLPESAGAGPAGISPY